MKLTMKTITPRTVEKIEALKASWRDDPIWDIEDSEGFDLHRDELRAYRLEWEARWRSEHEQRILKFATPLGLQNNPALAEYLMRQEAAIAELRAEIHRSKA